METTEPPFERLRRIDGGACPSAYETLDGRVQIFKHPDSVAAMGGWGYTSWEAFLDGESAAGWYGNEGHFATLREARAEIARDRAAGRLRIPGVEHGND